MAFEVSVIFNAINKFSGPVRKMTKSFDEFQKRNKRTQAAVKKTRSELKRFAAAALSVATVMKIFRVTSNFENRLLELSAITGATGKDLDFLKKSAFELGKSMAFSGAETLEAFKLVASAKPELLANLPALKNVTKEVLTLATASGIDLATASAFTAQSLNIFGKNAEHASRFVNVLAAGAKFGASEVHETGEALLIAGPAAKAAGLTFEQLNAAIQTTALGGIKAQRAGTALNSIFIKLQKAGFDLRKQKLENVFGIVEKALNSQKSAAARTQLAIQLFGEEHIKVAEALIANRGHLTAFERKLTGTNVATEQANIRLESLSKRWRIISTIIEQKVVIAMDKLRPIINSLLSGFEDILKVLTPQTIDDIAMAFRGLATILTPIVFVIKEFIKLFINALALIGKLGKTFGLIGAEIASGGQLNFFSELATIFSGNTQVEGTIGIDINDPGNNVDGVKSKSNTPGVDLPVGQNMAAAT